MFKEVLVFAEEIAKFGIDKENFKKLKDEANINAINCCFNKGYAVGVKGEVKFSFPVPSI